ncbi:hypothetical protein EDB81DRAFT_767998 [Dactylonectria macrodidyma]|uniref:Uncharacterized protein n=1 Tax=Dactylonectria macrodidyma TaxID=307937 RepID=A0A9P9D6H8_9HYPO|nr:hypothetical protein EDB81DRAFT_767998 [Dactylonectria macrodidyma]
MDRPYPPHQALQPQQLGWLYQQQLDQQQLDQQTWAQQQLRMQQMQQHAFQTLMTASQGHQKPLHQQLQGPSPSLHSLAGDIAKLDQSTAKEAKHQREQSVRRAKDMENVHKLLSQLLQKSTQQQQSLEQILQQQQTLSSELRQLQPAQVPPAPGDRCIYSTKGQKSKSPFIWINAFVVEDAFTPDQACVCRIAKASWG